MVWFHTLADGLGINRKIFREKITELFFFFSLLLRYYNMLACQTKSLIKRVVPQLRNTSLQSRSLYRIGRKLWLFIPFYSLLIAWIGKHGAFTVKPTGFWADKILERESKRPVVASTEPRLLVERTVSCLLLRVHCLTLWQMKDSYLEEYLPFKSDPELLDQYIFSDGKIRTGKLLEGIINADHLAISYPF